MKTRADARHAIGAASGLGAAVLFGLSAPFAKRLLPGGWRADMLGATAIGGACFSWALDNNLTRQISVRNPIHLVQVKTLSAGLGNVVLAAIAGHRAPASIVPAALLLGFVSYGLSIVLDVYALRYVGAAREAAFFAIALFVGAVAAVPILHERLAASDYGAGVLIGVGVVLVIRGWH